ncbi:MAG: glycosyltransferase [Elusimicrobia bacterium]|nr:glycosyltransferase [Elusimicrobiota bacterium]
MTGKPRVLLVTPVPPYPPDNGGLLRIFSLVTRLADRYDFSLLTFVRRTGERRFQQNAAAMALGRLFSQVHAVPKESTELPSAAVPDLPRTAREWFSPEMAAALARLTGEGRVDLVHVEFLQMAFYSWYVKGVPAVLTEHDLSHLSLFRSYFREWTGLRRFAQVGEWLATRRYHREVCSRFDGLVALTPADRDLLRRGVPEGKVSLIPTCVDLERFSFRPEPEPGAPVDLAYVGHYPHYPNEDAAVWFCRRVLPLLRRERPGVTLSLIGSSPTDAVRALAGGGVEVTGTVPDVRPCLDRAKVFIAPVRLGFGVKGKVLEAFARGLPVVATSIVQGGIPEARPEEHLLVADSPRSWARQCRRLLEDAALRRRLAAAGRALAERHYAWGASCAKLDELYRSLLEPRAARPEPAPSLAPSA